MTSSVNIIFDASGSFSIDGKDALIKNLLMTLISVCYKMPYKDVAYTLLEWSDDVYDIDPVDVYENYTQNCMQFNGKANFEQLANYINGIDDNSRFLLLSDGVFSDEEIIKLKKTFEDKKSIVVPVAVGSDAEKYNLIKLAAPEECCFCSEDLLLALHEISFRTYEKNVEAADNKINAFGFRRRVRF